MNVAERKVLVTLNLLQNYVPFVDVIDARKALGPILVTGPGEDNARSQQHRFDSQAFGHTSARVGRPRVLAATAGEDRQLRRVLIVTSAVRLQPADRDRTPCRRGLR